MKSNMLCSVLLSHRFPVLLTRRDVFCTARMKRSHCCFQNRTLSLCFFSLIILRQELQPHSILPPEGRVLQLMVCWSFPQSPFLEHTVLYRTQMWSGTVPIGFRTIHSTGQWIAAVDKKTIQEWNRMLRMGSHGVVFVRESLQPVNLPFSYICNFGLHQSLQINVLQPDKSATIFCI